MIYADRLHANYHAKNGYQIYVWYKSNRHITDFLTFEKSDLITKGNKKITGKSKPFVNVGCGFDCETSRFTNDVAMLDSFVYIWQFSIGRVTFLSRDFSLLSQFLLELSTMIKTLNSNATILIGDANINYEFAYFKSVFFPVMTKAFCKDKSHVCTFTLYNNLKFIEVLGVFGRNLATIAKNYCTTQKRKGDLDYAKIRTPHTHMSRKEILYSVNDVAILAELLPKAHAEYTLKGDNIPLTQTGIVRQEIMKSLVPNNFARQNLEQTINELKGTEQEYRTFRNYLYSGGLTHSNYKYVGVILDDIVCYDLTSAYPWALSVKKFPAGKLVKTTDIKTALQHPHWILDITISNICSKSTHSTISEHKCVKMLNAVVDNGRILKADEIRILVNEIDYKNIKSIYSFDTKHTHINNCWYFTKSAYCSDKILKVMQDWYIKKTILKPLTKDKHANDKDYTENCKTYMRLKQLINSCYGMLVTALYDTSIEINDDQTDFKEVSCTWENYSKTVFNMYIGYWCTAYVRQRLIQCISKCPNSIVQYDTDSIYCFKSDVQLKTYVDEINKEIQAETVKRCKEPQLWDLGQWDHDGEYTKFLGLGSKRYIGMHADGTYKITFAGASDEDIKAQAKATNTPIFEYIKNFNIQADTSTKTGAYHGKNEITQLVTDYKNNKYMCTTHGCITVINVPFKAYLAQRFSDLHETYCKAYTLKYIPTI